MVLSVSISVYLLPPFKNIFKFTESTFNEIAIRKYKIFLRNVRTV